MLPSTSPKNGTTGGVLGSGTRASRRRNCPHDPRASVFCFALNSVSSYFPVLQTESLWPRRSRSLSQAHSEYLGGLIGQKTRKSRFACDVGVMPSECTINMVFVREVSANCRRRILACSTYTNDDGARPTRHHSAGASQGTPAFYVWRRRIRHSG